MAHTPETGAEAGTRRGRRLQRREARREKRRGRRESSRFGFGRVDAPIQLGQFADPSEDPTIAAAEEAQVANIEALEAAARGEGPSAAQGILQQGQDAALRQQLALQASAQPGQEALAARGAATGAALASQQAAGQAGIIGAQEQIAAQGQLTGALGERRAQTLGEEELRRQTALQVQGLAIDRFAAAEEAQARRDERATSFIKDVTLGGIGAVTGGLGALFGSDERNKTHVTEGDDDVQQFLDSINPVTFNRGDETERRTGIMAQDLEKSPAGAASVKDTPQGKVVEGNELQGTQIAALGQLNERLQALEQGEGAAEVRKVGGALGRAGERIGESASRIGGRIAEAGAQQLRPAVERETAINRTLADQAVLALASGDEGKATRLAVLALPDDDPRGEEADLSFLENRAQPRGQTAEEAIAEVDRPDLGERQAEIALTRALAPTRPQSREAAGRELEEEELEGEFLRQQAGQRATLLQQGGGRGRMAGRQSGAPRDVRALEFAAGARRQRDPSFDPRLALTGLRLSPEQQQARRLRVDLARDLDIA